MTDSKDLVFLHSDTEINANVLKDILEDNQIGAFIRNDMKSGLTAGFGGGYMEAEARVYVTEENLEKAKALLDEFLKSLDKD